MDELCRKMHCVEETGQSPWRVDRRVRNAGSMNTRVRAFSSVKPRDYRDCNRQAPGRASSKASSTRRRASRLAAPPWGPVGASHDARRATPTIPTHDVPTLCMRRGLGHRPCLDRNRRAAPLDAHDVLDSLIGRLRSGFAITILVPRRSTSLALPQSTHLKYV